MNIAILSRKAALYSTQSLYKAVTKRGHQADVIDHLQCNLIMEQGRPNIMYKGRLLDQYDAIIPRIGASVTYYGSAVVRQFEMMDIFTPVTSGALLRSRDKLRSLQQFSRAGLGLPRTVFTFPARNAEEVVALAGGAPLIIKLLEGTQGLGVVLAETESASISVIEAFHNLQARVIVQEYIAEAKGSDVRVIVVDGKIIAAMKRTAKKGEFRSNLHRGGSSKVVELTELEKRTALKAAEVIGLDVAGVDMLQSNRGPLIMEINASPGLEGIEGTTKVDIAGYIVEFLERTHEKRKTNKGSTQGKRDSIRERFISKNKL